MLGALACAYLSLRTNALIARTGDNWNPGAADRVRAELVQEGTPAMSILERALRDPKRANWQVAEAYSEIGRRKAYPVLRELAESRRAGPSDYAIWALGATHERKALPFLLSKLSDKREQIPAAHALGELGFEDAVQPLALLLPEGQDMGGDAGPSLGWTASEALAKLGKPGALALAKALDAKEPLWTRVHAAHGLVPAKQPQTREAIARYVRTAPDDEALGDAVLALAELKDGRAFPIASNWIKADTGWVEIGFSCLLALGDERSLRLVEASLGGNVSVAQSLAGALKGRSNPRTLELLLRLLRRPEESVRSEVIWALHDIGDPAAAPALEELWPKAGSLRGDVEAALSQMHRPGVKALIRIYRRVQDSGKRMAAIQLLGESREPAAMPTLSAALTDPDPLIRNEAHTAAMRLFLRY